MHWRFGLAIILIAVAIGAQRVIHLRGQGNESGDITLTVNEWSSINRTSEPVTTGIPITPGQVGASWALFDGNTEIPLQTTVLPGRVTPWVLLDFQSSNSVGATKNYTLKQQPATIPPTQPVIVSEDASQITVSTGPIQTQISKTTFNLLDTVWLDSNSDGTFASEEKVVNPAADNLTIADVSVLDGGTGLVYSAVVAPAGFTWEYTGSLRRTLRVDGSYKNLASALPNNTLLDFTTRITWYAGQTHVKVEHVITNSYETKERWVKLTSAKLNVGTSTQTHRITRSGDLIWSNNQSGTSVQLLPTTLAVSDIYDPAGVGRVQYSPDIVIDSNGGMIIGDLSYHGATVQLDFAATLSGSEATRRITAAKDPMIALAPEAHYSDLSAFGAEHFGTYQDEKDTYNKWGWTWPTGGNSWSQEHSRPRVKDMYMTWSTAEANDFEADELWQNIMMLARVRIPYYLDRVRTYARFWNWEWNYRSDGYEFSGGQGQWFYGNGLTRTPAIQPTLTAADTDFINHNVRFAKADTTHIWNSGSIDYYYLTGDKDSLQAAIDLAEECKLLFYGSSYNHTLQNTSVSGTGSRGTIRCLQIFTRTWEATNDQQWKTAADGMLPYFLQSIAYDQRGFFYNLCNTVPPPIPDCATRTNGKFYNGFPTAVAVDALYRYYLLTNNQAVKTQLLQIAQFTHDTALDPVSGFAGANYIIDSPNQGDVFRSADTYGRDSKTFVNTMVVGYRLTGDSSYLTKAKLAWARGTKGVEGSEYANDTQVGRWANSLQAWDPYAGLFPEGGDLHYASFLFYDAARQDIVPPAAVIDLSAP